MDEIDVAQQYEQETRERQINAARRRANRPSRLTCEECEEPIPESRRVIVPGVTCCVACQQIQELKNKHYKGAV